MSNFYSLDLGTHHAIVMAYHDLQGIVPACIMNTFPSEYKDSDGTPITLAVIEDQHAIDRNDYDYTKETFEEYIECEAKNTGLELTPIMEYPSLQYDMAYNLTLGLLSHFFHECVRFMPMHEYAKELKDAAASTLDVHVRNGILDAFKYTRNHMPIVYNIAEWYYAD